MSELLDVLRKLEEHEKECARERVKVEARLTALEVSAVNHQRLVWLVFGTLVAFELNALFKIVGG